MSNIPSSEPLDDDEDDILHFPGSKALSPPEIESMLIELGRRIDTEPEPSLRHSGQMSLPEWRGSDVIVTSDFLFEAQDIFQATKLAVRTNHALPLTWLFMELWDVFAGHLDGGNKYCFYGDLAYAALDALASEQPDPDYRKVLHAVLSRSFDFLKFLRSHKCLPPDSMVVLHGANAEGQQIRIDAFTGEITA
jgi:hypothetical protein